MAGMQRRPFYPHGGQRTQVNSRTGKRSLLCTFGGWQHSHRTDRAASECAERAIREAARDGCTCTAHDPR